MQPETIKEAWKALPKVLIDRSIDNWRKRLQMVIEQDGGQIDHLL